MEREKQEAGSKTQEAGRGRVPPFQDRFRARFGTLLCNKFVMENPRNCSGIFHYEFITQKVTKSSPKTIPKGGGPSGGQNLEQRNNFTQKNQKNVTLIKNPKFGRLHSE